MNRFIKISLIIVALLVVSGCVGEEGQSVENVNHALVFQPIEQAEEVVQQVNAKVEQQEQLAREQDAASTEVPTQVTINNVEQDQLEEWTEENNNAQEEASEEEGVKDEETPKEQINVNEDESVQKEQQEVQTKETNSSSNKQVSHKQDSVNAEQQEKKESQQIEVSIKVYAPSTSVEYNVSVNYGDTAEQAMQQAKSNGLTYRSNSFGGLGAYITTINGLEEDTRNGFYWIYYINGQKAAAGVSSVKLGQDDLIEWRYEKAY